MKLRENQGNSEMKVMASTKRYIYLFILVTLFLFSFDKKVFAVNTRQATLLFNISIKSGNPLKQPSKAVVGKDGRIYVVDGVNNRVAVFNAMGKFIYDFGRGGTEKGELNFPLGIEIDHNSRIFVADSGNGRVQVFSDKGEYLYQFMLPKADNGRPSNPADLAISSDGQTLFIVDNKNHRLLSYDIRHNKFLNSVGSMGTRQGEFRWPFSIALDRDGYQYVVDVINTTVRVISPDGRFTFNIGEWGVNKGQFFRPKGVALDSKGLVYISDSYLGVIQVFDKEGTFMHVIGDENGKAKKFTTPVRLYIDENDRLFVVEMFADRIGVYKL